MGSFSNNRAFYAFATSPKPYVRQKAVLAMLVNAGSYLPPLAVFIMYDSLVLDRIVDTSRCRMS
jgi:hypothetical protein